MLTLVEAVNVRGETLALPLEDISDGVLIKDISGLDPVRAPIVASKFAQLDGTQYQAASRDERIIELTLGLEPDYAETDVRALRNAMYQYFMPKSPVTLKFHMDDEVYFAGIDGRVESCETALFTNEPELKAVIKCFDPDFIAPGGLTVISNTVSDMTETPVVYEGTIEVGFIFQMSISRPITEFTIYNTTPSGEITSLEIDGDFLAGDLIKITTIPGQKAVTLIRSGVQSSLLRAMSPSSTWLKLFPGTNNLRVQLDGTPLSWNLTHKTRYGGL